MEVEFITGPASCFNTCLCIELIFALTLPLHLQDVKLIEDEIYPLFNEWVLHITYYGKTQLDLRLRHCGNPAPACHYIAEGENGTTGDYRLIIDQLFVTLQSRLKVHCISILMFNKRTL